MTAHPSAKDVCGIIEKLLAKRGLSGADLEEFLDPSLKRLAKAAELPGISRAVDAIVPFLRGGRQIVVFGDYDCDGVCASAILVKALRRLGAKVDAFMPDRFEEGYGITPPSLKRMIEMYPDVALVITVDCGVTSVNEVRTMKERGIAVVVTDHHLPPETLPVCDALIDPKVATQCETAKNMGADELSGAGVAFFLANAIASRAVELGIYRGGKFGAPLLILAGLATVVDNVPLLKQNRIIAANALRMFRSFAPMGLNELLLRAERRPVDLTSRDFCFLLGPRINAAGRMASAMDAYDLLMAESRETARNLAQSIDVRNVERKSIENFMIEDAQAQIVGDPSPAIAVCDVDGSDAQRWHHGVCGIVASRLMEKYGVPVAVVVEGRGSARAPEGYNVHAALSTCSETLERFGGHTAAGGFTVKDGMFAEFRAAFMNACAAQCGEGSSAAANSALREPDVWIEPSDLTMELHQELKAVEPFGECNPEPVFGLRGVTLDAKPLGENGKHMSITFQDRRIPRATWWNHGNMVENLRAKAYMRFDITFTLDVSEWCGEEPHLELRLCGIAESTNMI